MKTLRNKCIFSEVEKMLKCHYLTQGFCYFTEEVSNYAFREIRKSGFCGKGRNFGGDSGIRELRLRKRRVCQRKS